MWIRDRIKDEENNGDVNIDYMMVSNRLWELEDVTDSIQNPRFADGLTGWTMDDPDGVNYKVVDTDNGIAGNTLLRMGDSAEAFKPVSYTHLDVYKRQGASLTGRGGRALGSGAGKACSRAARPSRTVRGGGSIRPPKMRRAQGSPPARAGQSVPIRPAASRDGAVRRMRPPSITAVWSAMGRASSSRCSVSRMVVPSSRLIRSRAFRKEEAALGSSWAVGSSNSSRLGCIIMTAARFSSCFCPPDRLAVSAWNQSAIPKKPHISPKMCIRDRLCTRE